VETFGVRSLKIKIFPASNALNCEGWANLERRPRPGLHIVQQFLLPGEFRMRLEVTGGAEMDTARVV
jgi:hypothetical protein